MTASRFLPGEVADLATVEEYIRAVREAYRQVGEGAPARPRTALFGDAPPGMFTGYLAILPETGVMGGYTYAAGFEGRDAWFVTPLFDARTGELLAVIDGAAMNPLKTGAAGAVGVDELARPDAKSLALIGSGRQARGQLVAIATVRDLERVEVYSPTRDHRETFAAHFDERLEAAVRPAASSNEAVEGADIVVTATTASEPVIDGDYLEDGTHITAMGQYHPRKRELDTNTIAKATYVPDLRERALQDAGSFLHALGNGFVDEDHIHAELGEVVAGAAPGRPRKGGLTVFDSGGTAIETTAAASLLYEKALEAGIGERLAFAPASEAMPSVLQ